MEDDGQVRYFEPAVLAAPNAEEAEAKLKLWARYSDTDGGVLENVIAYPPGEIGERTLVLIKPDNFHFATGRPGNVIDFFSRTGLYIVGVKVLHMSVAQAMEFYGPVREVLRTKLKDARRRPRQERAGKGTRLQNSRRRAKSSSATFSARFRRQPVREHHAFHVRSRAVRTADARNGRRPGTEKCIALIYEGVNAVRKIRDVLGPTDPSKAPPGSIRREFGSTITVNAAHASDSRGKRQRELDIVNVGENNFRQIIEEAYGKL